MRGLQPVHINVRKTHARQSRAQRLTSNLRTPRRQVAQGLKNDLVLTPGTMLSKAADANSFLRFNVAHSDDLQVRERFFRLLDK